VGAKRAGAHAPLRRALKLKNLLKVFEQV